MDAEKGTLVAVIMAAVLYVAVSLAIIAYLISFKKREFKESFINKKGLISIFVVLGLNLPVVIVGFIFEFTTIISSTAPLIVMIVIAFVLTVIVGIYVFLYLQTLAIGIDEKEIAFLGERILIRKIMRIERNDKTNQLIIHYTEGTRSKKKCRYSLASQAGQFILSNVELLNQEVMMFVSEDESKQVMQPEKIIEKDQEQKD